MSDVTDFQDREVRETLYRNQRRLHTVIVTLFVIMMIVTMGAMTAVVIFEIEAKEGREQLRSCIDSEGVCAQRSAEQGVNLISASIVCSQRSGITTKQEAIDCITEVLSP